MRKCRIAGMKKRHFILGAVHVNRQNRRGVIVILLLHILPFKLKQSCSQFERVHCLE